MQKSSTPKDIVVHLRLPRALHNAYKRQAEEHLVPVGSWFRTVLNNNLKDIRAAKKLLTTKKAHASISK